MDKYIEFMDGNHVISKQKRQVRIKMCDDNGDTFIAILHNILLAPDLRNRLFSIIKLMKLGHPCLFNKILCTVYFGDKEKNAVNLPHSAHQKHTFSGKIKQTPKTKKLAPRKKISLELLHQRLGHRYTKSLMSGDTANV